MKIYTLPSTTTGRIFIFIILTGLLLISNLPGQVYAKDSLILAVHPYLSQDELLKKFTPLADYLSKRIGKTVKVRIGSNYEEHIQYIGQDKVDIAYMGPAPYVKLVNQFGEKPILARLEINGHPWFQGNIITRNDSGIKTLEDLKGKRIAFGDPNSTMSYLVPNYMLHKAGVFTDPLTKYQFLYSHSNVALGVLTGDFDAGAVKPEVFKKHEAEGLYTIAMTPRISEHLFVTRSTLPAGLIEALRKIMYEMKDSEDGRAALKAINKNTSALVKASNSDYENLRVIILESEKLK